MKFGGLTDHKLELQRVQNYSAVFIHSFATVTIEAHKEFIDNASKDKFPTFQFIKLLLNL